MEKSYIHYIRYGGAQNYGFRFRENTLDLENGDKLLILEQEESKPPTLGSRGEFEIRVIPSSIIIPGKVSRFKFKKERGLDISLVDTIEDDGERERVKEFLSENGFNGPYNFW